VYSLFRFIGKVLMDVWGEALRWGNGYMNIYLLRTSVKLIVK